MGDLLDIAREALSIVRSAGAQWADVACGRARELGVEIEGSSIKSAESADSEGLSIRAFFRGGQASVTLEGLDLVAVRRAACEAAEPLLKQAMGRPWEKARYFRCSPTVWQ